MEPLSTITIDEILKRLRKFLGLNITRSTLYAYIKFKEFPPSMGIGKPRLWKESEVDDWIQRQIEK